MPIKKGGLDVELVKQSPLARCPSALPPRSPFFLSTLALLPASNFVPPRTLQGKHNTKAGKTCLDG